MKNAPYILLWFLMAWGIHASAQQESERVYLKSPSEQYQNWLDKKGLGKILWVYGDSLQTDSTQLVYLEFKYATSDSASAAWNQLIRTYQEEFIIGIDEALYYQALHYYASDEQHTIVYIYDDYDKAIDESCFKKAIYTNDENQVAIDDGGTCKSFEADIVLELPDLKGMTTAKAQKIKSKYTKEFVFDNIYAYAEKYYRQKHPNSRIKRWTSKENTMRFEVWNLQKEILVDEAVSSIQKFLNWCCKANVNWVRREMLVVTIHYEKTDKGASLHCIVQGKFGSGFYSNISKNAYIDMEQVTRFEEYLKDYADEQLKQYKRVLKNLQR